MRGSVKEMGDSRFQLSRFLIYFLFTIKVEKNSAIHVVSPPRSKFKLLLPCLRLKVRGYYYLWSGKKLASVLLKMN